MDKSAWKPSASADHIVAEPTVVKANVEEGVKGETVALVMKDIHTQLRHVNPSKSKSGDSCVSAFNHFLSHKDEVDAVYTDNSRELIATIGELGYRHQTSTEYVDSSKSFVERETIGTCSKVLEQTLCSQACQCECGRSPCSTSR